MSDKELAIYGVHGDVKVCFNVNWFDLPKETRDKLYEIIDDLRQALEETTSDGEVPDRTATPAKSKKAKSPETPPPANSGSTWKIEEAPANYVSWIRVYKKLRDGIIHEFRCWKSIDKALGVVETVGVQYPELLIEILVEDPDNDRVQLSVKLA